MEIQVPLGALEVTAAGEFTEPVYLSIELAEDGETFEHRAAAVIPNKGHIGVHFQRVVEGRVCDAPNENELLRARVSAHRLVLAEQLLHSVTLKVT